MIDSDESSVINEAVAESRDMTTEVAQETKENSKEYNFRELRAAMAEKERRLQEMESRLQSMQTAKKEEPDEFDALDDDDIPSAKLIKKLSKELKEIKAQKSRSDISPEDVSRLKFRDYDEVVSEENVKAHLLSNPVLAQMVKGSANPYEAAYHLLKKFQKPAEKSPDFTKKLEEVAQKPRSLNEAAPKSSGMGKGSSMQDLEAARSEALKRAQKYLGGYY